MSKTIPTTPELLGVFGSHNASTVNQVGNQMDAEVITVANSSNEINLTLPYYSFLEGKTASTVSDSDLDAASGGEASPEQVEAATWLAQNVPHEVILENRNGWTVETVANTKELYEGARKDHENK